MPFNCFDNARINKKREISCEWPACWGSCFSFLIWYETARRGEACKSPVQVLARAIKNANNFFSWWHEWSLSESASSAFKGTSNGVTWYRPCKWIIFIFHSIFSRRLEMQIEFEISFCCPSPLVSVISRAVEFDEAGVVFLKIALERRKVLHVEKINVWIGRVEWIGIYVASATAAIYF